MRRPSRGAAGGETRRKAGKHWGRWDKGAEEGMNEKTKQGSSGGRDQGWDGRGMSRVRAHKQRWSATASGCTLEQQPSKDLV